MNEDIVKEEHELFRKWGNDFSFPMATPLKAEMRNGVLKHMEVTWEELDGDPHRKAEYLNTLGSWLHGAAFAMKQGILGSKDAPTDTVNQPVRKRIRQKDFDHRFRIVKFITEWLARTGHNRVKWSQVVAQWNKENPFDQYEKPSSMEKLYNNARKENGIMVQLLTLKVLEGSREGRARLFSEAFRYLDMMDKDIEFAKRVMAMFGIRYNSAERSQG